MAPVLAFPGRTAADLLIAALGPSRGRGCVALGAISRSDRGSQHAPEAMADRSAAHDVRLPAGETGPRHDDAVAEPFLGTSEDETCHPRDLATRKEARLASAGYVEGCHDRRRPHPAIDYHIPERRWTHSSSAWTRWSRERRRCHWRHDYGPLAVQGVETVHWASLDEWGAELPGGRDAGAGGLWAGLEGLCGPEGGWSAGPRAYSPASRAFLSPDPEAPDASDPATAAAYACAGGSPLSMVDPSGGRAVFAQDPLRYLGERMSDAGELLAGGARDVAELAGIVDRRTESYVVPLCSGLFRGQRTAYGVNWHGVLDLAGMIPGVGPWADLANAGLYIWEGDWLGAGQSLWSALPGIGDAFQGTKVATGVSKFASHGDDLARVGARAGSHADEVADAARAAGKAGDVAKAAGRVTNSPKAVRKFWNSLEKVGKGLRKEGKGRKAVYYVIDYLHNEFEKYDHKGDHLGAVDPNTGEIYKPPVPGRNIRDRL